MVQPVLFRFWDHTPTPDWDTVIDNLPPNLHVLCVRHIYEPSLIRHLPSARARGALHSLRKLVSIDDLYGPTYDAEGRQVAPPLDACVRDADLALLTNAGIEYEYNPGFNIEFPECDW